MPVAVALASDLQARAEAGDPWAQLNLGAAHDHGLSGIEPDAARAVFWYRRAARAGLAEAQFNLAHCLASGAGVTRNDDEAAIWMRRAAEQGLADAEFLYGVMLLEGIGVTPDSDQARSWLRRAAAQGQTDANELLQRLPGSDSRD
jgi:hypothetical protein